MIWKGGSYVTPAKARNPGVRVWNPASPASYGQRFQRTDERLKPLTRPSATLSPPATQAPGGAYALGLVIRPVHGDGGLVRSGSWGVKEVAATWRKRPKPPFEIGWAKNDASEIGGDVISDAPVRRRTRGRWRWGSPRGKKKRTVRCSRRPRGHREVWRTRSPERAQHSWQGGDRG